MFHLEWFFVSKWVKYCTFHRITAPVSQTSKRRTDYFTEMFYFQNVFRFSLSQWLENAQLELWRKKKQKQRSPSVPSIFRCGGHRVFTDFTMLLLDTRKCIFFDDVREYFGVWGEYVLWICLTWSYFVSPFPFLFISLRRFLSHFLSNSQALPIAFSR